MKVIRAIGSVAAWPASDKISTIAKTGKSSSRRNSKRTNNANGGHIGFCVSFIICYNNQENSSILTILCLKIHDKKVL